MPAVDSEMDWIDEPAEEQEEATEYFHKVLNDSPKRRKPRDHKLDTQISRKTECWVETGCHDM